MNPEQIKARGARKLGRPSRGPTTMVNFKLLDSIVLRLKRVSSPKRPQRLIVEELLDKTLPHLPPGA